jgi:arsenite-transporting ATPase
MSLSDLDESGKRLIMFGGKGGVGKTTCAAATAIHFALLGKKTLAISSDPTPSLSDIFEFEVGSEHKPIPGVKNLYALEISSEIVLERWKEKYGPEIYEVISSFAPVEYDILDYIGGAPGIEEEYMLGYILELVESGEYDLIVWDTAPAGHTLHLLKMPEIFISHLEEAAKVYVKLYSYLEKLRETVGLRRGRRSVIDIIDGWKALAEKVMNFIKDRSSTEFIATTIPEALGVRLTERLLKTFNDSGIHVKHLIINNVIDSPDCEFHRARMEMQKKYIDVLVEKYGRKMRIVKVPLFPYEIKGVEKLTQVSEILFA